jgi:D-alanyl-D-alanine carboxypeptidase
VANDHSLSLIRDPRLKHLAQAYVAWLKQNGIGVTVTSVIRSSRLQAQLYDDYIHGRRRLPAAKPGTSKHERGLAFDMVVTPRNYQTAVGLIWEKLGGRWGGRFKDPVHFELPG